MAFRQSAGGPSSIGNGIGDALEALRVKIGEDLRLELAEVKEGLKDIQAKLAFNSGGGWVMDAVQSQGTLTRGNSAHTVRSEPSMRSKGIVFNSEASPIPAPASDSLAQDLQDEDMDEEARARGRFSERAYSWMSRKWDPPSTYQRLLDQAEEGLDEAQPLSELVQKKMKWNVRGDLLKDGGEDGIEYQSWAEAIVFSRQFELFVGSFVLINAVFIGVEANVECVYHMQPPLSLKSLFQVVEFIFMLVFLLEWSLRVSVFRCGFFSMEGGWTNVFDTCVLASQVVEQLLELTANLTPEQEETEHGSSSLTGMLRILRLFRIVRMARLLHLFTELGMLLASIIEAFHTLVWALTLMLAMVYAFSVYFAQRVSQSTHGQPPQRLFYFFGDVPRTSLTLMECILGGINWDEPVMWLFTEVGYLSGLLCILFVGIGLFILVNIVTGVFIDRTMKTAGIEEDRKIAEDLAIAFGLSEDGMTWSKQRAHEQTLDFQHFRTKLQEPALHRYFEKIDLEVDDHHIQKFFNLLDADGSGDVTATEMYAGCLRMRGAVRAVDLALFSYDQQELLGHQTKRIERLEHMLVQLSQGLNVRVSHPPTGRRSQRKVQL